MNHIQSLYQLKLDLVLLESIKYFLILFCFNFLYSQKIYEVDYKSQADALIHVVDYKYQADLLVYNVDYKSEAKNNNGLWFKVDYKSQADLKIYYTKYKSQADINIYIVKYKSQAGWTDDSKKELLKKK